MSGGDAYCGRAGLASRSTATALTLTAGIAGPLRT